MVKVLRVIRFDPSDTHVFDRAAEPDDLAVPGSLVFATGAFGQPEQLSGKPRQAFVSGFFGLESFGFSTVVSVGDVREEELEAARSRLIVFLLEDCGAPSEDHARHVAEQEVAYACDLARDLPLNTLLAMRREVDEAGQIREEFSIVSPPGEKPHARIWDVVEENE